MTGSELTLEEQLRRVAADWTETFDAIESPILILNENLHIHRLNIAAARLIGKAPPEAVRLGLPDLEGRFWRELERVLVEAQEDPAARKDRHLRAEAFGRTWSVLVHPTFSLTRSERWFVAVATDVTDLTVLRESLRRQERLAAVGALVTNISHEVRNYLFSISGLVEAMEQSFGEHEDLRVYITSLGTEVGRLRKLMTGLLEYGRPGRLEPSREIVHDLVREAVTAVRPRAEGQEVALVVHDRNSDVRVSVDRVRWRQVLVNVLDNAIVHSPKGGEVTLEVDGLSDEGLPQVHFRVRDQGPGFDEADLPRLFEPFFSRRPGGIGLGLSIVQRLVDLHGGDVRLCNPSGGGALVEIVLPVTLSGDQTVPSGQGAGDG